MVRLALVLIVIAGCHRTQVPRPTPQQSAAQQEADRLERERYVCEAQLERDDTPPERVQHCLELVAWFKQQEAARQRYADAVEEQRRETAQRRDRAIIFRAIMGAR